MNDSFSDAHVRCGISKVNVSLNSTVILMELRPTYIQMCIQKRWWADLSDLNADGKFHSLTSNAVLSSTVIDFPIGHKQSAGVWGVMKSQMRAFQFKQSSVSICIMSQRTNEKRKWGHSSCPDTWGGIRSQGRAMQLKSIVIIIECAQFILGTLIFFVF